VNAGTFHHFHNLWISDLCKTLNSGLLPESFYAMGEQVARDIGPDVLTLRAPAATHAGLDELPPGATALAEAPPRVSFTTELDREALLYSRRRRAVVIRHISDHEIVALLEIVSPGNRSSQHELESLLSKLIAALDDGYHLVVIDLFPPNRVTPAGVHGALIDALSGDVYQSPSDRPLTLAAYVAGLTPRAYVEPTRVGAVLHEMPLFLSPGCYVTVPLEQTYTAAWAGMPAFWKDVLEGRSDPPRRH
jgi:hypothetical protein